jgi:hypothetical protein
LEDFFFTNLLIFFEIDTNFSHIWMSRAMPDSRCTPDTKKPSSGGFFVFLEKIKLALQKKRERRR